MSMAGETLAVTVRRGGGASTGAVIEALDAATGDLLWTSNGGAELYANPGDGAIFLTHLKGMGRGTPATEAVDTATGRTVWKPARYGVAADHDRLIVTGNRVYMLTSSGKFLYGFER